MPDIRTFPVAPLGRCSRSPTVMTRRNSCLLSTRSIQILEAPSRT